MYLAAMCVIALLVAARNVPGLLKNKEWGILLLGGCFIVIGLGLSILLQYDVKTPSLAGLMISLVKTVLPFMPAFYGF